MEASRGRTSNTTAREGAILAVLAALSIFVLYGLAFLEMLAGSFMSNVELGSAATFVWGSNYTSVWRDPAYGQAFVASIAFALLCTFLQVGWAFAAAILTRRNFPGVRSLRWILVAPYFLPSVVVVVAWRFFSDPFVGLLPAGIRAFGFTPFDWRGPTAALPVMVLVATYEAFPFTYVVLLARMLQISPSLYEVAELTGASAWKVFRAVTWPQVRLAFGGLALVRILITWLKFDVPWLVYASRAPSPWGDTLAVVIYRTAFENLQSGKAYAASVGLLVCALGGYLLWRIGANAGGRR